MTVKDTQDMIALLRMEVSHYEGLLQDHHSEHPRSRRSDTLATIGLGIVGLGLSAASLVMWFGNASHAATSAAAFVGFIFVIVAGWGVRARVNREEAYQIRESRLTEALEIAKVNLAEAIAIAGIR